MEGIEPLRPERPKGRELIGPKFPEFKLRNVSKPQGIGIGAKGKLKLLVSHQMSPREGELTEP